MKLPELDSNGQLPAYAWPGGYPIFYVTKDCLCVCPKCANRETDDSQKPVEASVNWEDTNLICDDCGEPIESAYGEE